MKGKLPAQEQRNIFRPILIEIINPCHEVAVLSAKVEWKRFENDFGQLYSNTGKPGVPIRTMVGLLMLKRLYNLGDTSVMEEWVQNPYFQYFCGESEFQWKFPCDPSDLVYFRKRIGTEGAELIAHFSDELFKDKIRQNHLPAGIISSEKEITHPSEGKILTRIIELCKNIANKGGH